jgi:uncharacterized protein (TIGR04222 family)
MSGQAKENVMNTMRSQNADQQALYDQLMAFEIDDPGTELTFARRLARENGWSLLYAERVIDEYKKFLFLACEAGHVVSPSEQVDQAWHLHLTYTRSYWNELCQKVLGKPLHHGPTKGGAAEQTKFIDLYNQTLASYERLLGEKPPADIWSPADRRFGEDLRHVTVNIDRNWIIPKPRLPAWRPVASSNVPLFALGLIGLPLAAITNPLDFRGPQFLAFYIGITLIAAVAALVTRIVFDGETENPDPRLPKLDPYEVACLSAGPHRSVQAAFAALVQDGALSIEEEKTTTLGIFPTTKRRIKQAKPLPKSAADIEQALYKAVAIPATDLAPISKAGQPIAQAIEHDLRQRGLIAGHGPTIASFAAGLLMASPLLIGVPKIFIGLSRGRPVEFLIVCCFLTLFAVPLFMFARSRLTTAGKAALESLKKEHASFAVPAYEGATGMKPHDLALALGLFGCAMIATGPLASVHAMLPKAAGGGGCTTSGGGCGGGGCGGGGCGGGCGGCGG